MKPRINPRKAILRHARYYIQIMHEANNSYCAGGRFIDAGLQLFDRERENLDVAWKRLQEQAGDEEVDLLLIEASNSSGFIGEIRYRTEDELVPQLEAALAAAKRLRYQEAQGALLGNLGSAFHRMGHYKKAIKLSKQSIAIARSVGNEQGEAIALGVLGHGLRHLGKFEEAKECYERQLLLVRKLQDRRNEVVALSNLGDYYFTHKDLAKRDLAKARTYYEEQLKLAHANGDYFLETKALESLGNVCAIMGDSTGAIEQYNKGLSIARSIGARAYESDILRNMSAEFVKLGEAQQGLEMAQQALLALHLAGEGMREEQIYGAIGRSQMATGDKKAAQESLLHRLVIAKKSDNRSGQLQALSDLGDLMLVQNNDRVSAVMYYKQAYTIAKKMRDEANVARIEWNLGLVFYLNENWKQSLPHLEVGVAYYRNYGNLVAGQLSWMELLVTMAKVQNSGIKIVRINPGKESIRHSLEKAFESNKSKPSLGLAQRLSRMLKAIVGRLR